ncbi:MAG: hypothetical protein HND52_10215 [Ignavibacteriae bacterium]|nr:hypothetical protein [Ignavibacteriota bacterium]NOG98322.1 hypothetical protein [Ignavibacteriota bacterium]
MQKTLRKIGVVLLFIFIGFFGFKSCISTVLSFDEKNVYEKINTTGQIDRIFIVSTNDIIFSKNLEGTYELAHFHIRGEYATNYFGQLYNVGTFPFGLRIYPNAKDVYLSEMELTNKYGNVTQSTFDEIETKYNSVIIIYNDAIKINDELYNQIEFSEEDINRMLDLFEILK